MNNESAGDKGAASPGVRGSNIQARLFAVMALLLALVPSRVDAATAGGSTRSGSQGRGRAATQPTVTLLTPGAEPRQVLRFQPKAGDRQTVSFTMKMSMDALRTNMPLVLGTMQVRVKSVSADGVITFERVITDISMSPVGSGVAVSDKKSMEAASAEMKSVITSGVISSRSFSRLTDVKHPNSDKQLPAIARLVLASMNPALERLSPPLPEAAIGVGGKWEVKWAEGQSGIEKWVYEIVSINGSRIAAKAVLTMDATDQAPKGLLTSGSGSGDILIDLGHIVPAKGNLSQRYEASATKGGEKVPMKMQTYLRIEAN